MIKPFPQGCYRLSFPMVFSEKMVNRRGFEPLRSQQVNRNRQSEGIELGSKSLLSPPANLSYLYDSHQHQDYYSYYYRTKKAKHPPAQQECDYRAHPNMRPLHGYWHSSSHPTFPRNWVSENGIHPQRGPTTVGNMKPTKNATIHTTIATPSAFHQPML